TQLRRCPEGAGSCGRQRLTILLLLSSVPARIRPVGESGPADFTGPDNFASHHRTIRRGSASVILQLGFLLRMMDVRRLTPPDVPGKREGSWYAPVASLEQTRGHRTPFTRSKAMRPLQGMVWGCALAILAVAGSPAHAAWNNVFQLCCSSCGGSPAP